MVNDQTQVLSHHSLGSFTASDPPGKDSKRSTCFQCGHVSYISCWKVNLQIPVGILSGSNLYIPRKFFFLN